MGKRKWVLIQAYQPLMGQKFLILAKSSKREFYEVLRFGFEHGILY
jgi:hypothetical protein